MLLDEPTNHLDIPSKEILLRALQNYQGTMLFVSHDKDFVNDLATHVIELTQNGAYFYHGNYDSYIAQKNAFAPQSGKSKTTGKSKKLAVSEGDIKALNKEIVQVERRISQIESKIEKLNAAFADLDYGTKEFSDNQEKLAVLKKDLVGVEKEWEILIHKKGL